MGLLDGHRAVVTGGASGIGAQTARRMTEEGARVALLDLNGDGAETLAKEAVEICDAIGDRFTLPFAFSGLAAIATARGQSERAATLVGAAESIMEANNMAWPPDERPHYERMLAELPAAMGTDAFEQARASGRSMSTEAAVDRALGGAITPEQARP